MKKSTKRMMTLVIGTILAVQIVGVALILVFNAVHEHRYHRDLLATQDLTLQFTGPAYVELQDPHAYARKDGLVVSGCLNSVGSATGPATTEVDVRLVSAKGAVLQETTIRDLSRCKRGGVHFSAKLSVVPTDGSVLTVAALVLAERASTPEPLTPDG